TSIGVPPLKLRTITSCLHHLLDIPRAPTFSVVAYAVSAINGHDCGCAACHPLSDISNTEVRFRQKRNDPANFRFRQPVTLSCHKVPPPGERVPLFCNQKSSVAAYNGKRYAHDTTANIKVAPVLVQLTSAVEECQAALWISGSWLARVIRMFAANLDDRATRLNAVIWVDQGLSLRSSAALRPWKLLPDEDMTQLTDKKKSKSKRAA